jgi:hypothetical protein
VEKLLALQARLHGGPVYAANLCASANYAPPPSEAEAMAAVEALASTGGQVVNGWLDGTPGLAMGETRGFDARPFEKPIRGNGQGRRMDVRGLRERAGRLFAGQAAER